MKALFLVFLLEISSAGPAIARTIPPDPVRDETDDIYHRGRCPEALDAVIAALKRRAEDSNLSRIQRGHALRRIGDLAIEFGRAELVEYFSLLTYNPHRQDTYKLLGRSASIELWKLREAQREGLADKNDFLLRELTSTAGDNYQFAARRWAVEELCSRGDGRVLPIAESLFLRSSSPRMREIYYLCKARLDLSAKYPRREEALAAALQSRESFSFERLHFWAIDELGKLKSKESAQILLAVGLGREPYDLQSDSQRSQALRRLKDRGFSYEELKDWGADQQDLYLADISPGSKIGRSDQEPCSAGGED